MIEMEHKGAVDQMHRDKLPQFIGAALFSGSIATLPIKGSPTDAGWQSFLLNWVGWTIFGLTFTSPFWARSR